MQIQKLEGRVALANAPSASIPMEVFRAAIAETSAHAKAAATVSFGFMFGEVVYVATEGDVVAGILAGLGATLLTFWLTQRMSSC